MRFPPVRIIRDGTIDTEWEKYIAANVRAPGAGPERHPLDDRVEQHRRRASSTRSSTSSASRPHREYCEINKDLSEQVLRERIAKMPDGVYEAVDWNEFDGHDGPDQLLELRLRLEVDGSDLRFFYTGVPQIDAFVNSTDGPDVRPGDDRPDDADGLRRPAGQRRPLAADHVDIGEPGTIVNAVPPAPVSNAHSEVGMRACKLAKDVLCQALRAERRPGPARPHRRPAPGRLPRQRAVRHQPARRRLGGLLPGQRDRLGRRRPDDQRRPGRLRADLHDRRRHPRHREPRGRRPGAVPVAPADPELGRPGPDARRPVARPGLRDPLQRPDGRPGLQRLRAGAAARLRRRLSRAAPGLLPRSATRTSPSCSRQGIAADDASASRARRRWCARSITHIEARARRRLRRAQRRRRRPRRPAPARRRSWSPRTSRDDYVTADHATGRSTASSSTASGELDAEATDASAARRSGARGSAASREAAAAPPPSIGVSLAHRERRVDVRLVRRGARRRRRQLARRRRCSRRRPIAERFAELEMQVRDRLEAPRVMIREHYCPSCATSLGVDVATDGPRDAAGAARAGRRTPRATVPDSTRCASRSALRGPVSWSRSVERRQSRRQMRILIVDDHEIVREGVRASLSSDPRIEVVGEAAETGKAALECVRQHAARRRARRPAAARHARRGPDARAALATSRAPR